MCHGLTRSNLSQRTRRVLKRGARRNPDVYLVDGEEGALVVKDFAPRGALVRWWIGPFLQRRELRAYRALAGHPAVPRMVDEIDSRAIALEYRPGEPVSRKLRGRVSDSFLGELSAAVAEMHRRGVAHLDLKHRSNVLVGEDGKPVLIDFASAVCLRPGSWTARILIPLLGWVDRRALEKWRVRLDPQAEPATSPGSGGEGASGSGRGARRPT